MTRQVEIDFSHIHTWKRLYKVLRQNLDLPEHFGNNLDALWDSLTGYIELPVKIQFDNLSPFHMKKFEKLISVFEDAETELDGELTFSYSTNNLEDDIG